MLRFRVVLVTAVALVLLVPAGVAAQDQDGPLSDLLPQLYADAIIGEYTAFVTVLPQFGIPVDADELFDEAIERYGIASQIIYLAGNQLSSFPLGSSSGGFTWNVDVAAATFTRASNSFGPIFAERPLTIGRKRLNVGANYQHVTFDRLDGRSLRNGEIVGYFGPRFGTFGIFFADSLDVTVTTDTFNAFATYGITDRLDVGVAVPVNRVSVNASLTSRIGDTIDGIDPSFTPFVTSASGTASGIGDMVIRAKYNMLNRETVGIAEFVDVRLPTGDERNLLGVGGSQFKLGFIASSAVGRLSPHVNIAYTISGTSSAADDLESVVVAPPEEISYAGGADLAVTLRTTVAFDAVGRVLRKVGTLTWAPSAFGEDFPQFELNRRQDLHLLLGSLGVRVNPFGNMLLTANILFPMTDSGLTDSLTWTAGVDYSF